RENFSSRGQYGINDKNMLNFNLEYATNTRTNQGIGQTSLPERASNSSQKQYGFQFRETAILSTRFLNEARLEITQNRNTTNPVTMSRSITVLDAFSAGGSQNVTDTTNKSFLFGDTLTFNKKILTLKTGVQGDYYRNRAYNANNFLGSYTFSRLNCFDDPNNPDPIVDMSTDPRCAGAYVANRPTTFSMNTGNPLIMVSQFEFGAFVQSDLKLSNKLIVSPGVRYQIQNHLNDYNNFDPRLSIAYQLSKTAVLRFGAGTF